MVGRLAEEGASVCFLWSDLGLWGSWACRRRLPLLLGPRLLGLRQNSGLCCVSRQR